jgi:large-conductance mechanosensitive channel
VAFVLFLLVKFINKLHKKTSEQQNIELKESNEQLKVLKEIRDLLVNRPVIHHEHEL